MGQLRLIQDIKSPFRHRSEDDRHFDNTISSLVVRYLHRTGNGYANKRPEQQGGNARSAVERDHDGLWSAMKSGITTMTGSVSPSPGSSRYALHAMKSNTWGSASSGVKRTKWWLIWLSSTGGPFRAHLTIWMRPLTCGGNALVMPGNWISRGSKRRGLHSRMRQQQRATTSLLRISFRWSLRFRLSRRRALQCPPSVNKRASPAMRGQSRRTNLYPAHRP